MIQMYSVQNREPVIQTLTEQTSNIRSVDFNVDGTMLVSVSADSFVVTLLNVDNSGILSLKKKLYGHKGSVYAVKFSPNGKFIASGSGPSYQNEDDQNEEDDYNYGVQDRYQENDYAIMIWNIEGLLMYTLTGHTEEIYSLSFTPDGKTLASGSMDHTIRLWDMENKGAEIGSFTEHTGSVNSLDFNHDGTQLASGSEDETLRIWNFKSSTLSHAWTLPGHASSISSVKYSPDGEYLASGSYDWTVKLWNVGDDYNLFETFRGHTGGVTSIDFIDSADGQKIATGSQDKTILIWGLACAPGYTGTYPDCQPCAPGTYQDLSDMGRCNSCPPGTYQHRPGAAECDACSSGTFQALEGKTQCDACQMGGYCPDDTEVVTCDGGFTPCPIGTFNNVKGKDDATSCAQCPPGKFFH